jgi:endonuclease-3
MKVPLIRLLTRLRDEYGEPERMKPRDPLDELIFTILSQNTSDLNRDRAYRSLRERFPTNLDLAQADPSDIEKAIRNGGLARSKSVNIHGILKDLSENKQGIDLDYLKDMRTEDAMKELTSMKGVGSKTAACVMIFSLDRPVFPVDTHIHRIVKRWGLADPKETREHVQERMNELVPDEWKYQGHLLIIKHGKEICKARKPLCGTCVVSDLCPRIGVNRSQGGTDEEH